MNLKTISIIGLGYIGLPTAAVFASRKIKVIGVKAIQRISDNYNRRVIYVLNEVTVVAPGINGNMAWRRPSKIF